MLCIIRTLCQEIQYAPWNACGKALYKTHKHNTRAPEFKEILKKKIESNEYKYKSSVKRSGKQKQDEISASERSIFQVNTVIIFIMSKSIEMAGTHRW